MKVNIPDAEWLRGEGSAYSTLYRKNDNKSCCLGHVLRAFGYSNSQLHTLTTPAEVINFGRGTEVPDGLTRPLTEYVPLITNKAVVVNTELCQRLMTVNDKSNISDDDRKQVIADGLRTIGIEVTFE